MKTIFNLLRRLTPVFEYVGNMNQIHWSSWTATADGVIVMEIGWTTGGSGGYYYVKDTTANREIAKMTTYSANGTSETRCFPVIKGHTYKVSAYERVDGNHLNFFFYKLKLIGGGYYLTALFHRLAERWWKYEDCTETAGCYRFVHKGTGSKTDNKRRCRGIPARETQNGKIVESISVVRDLEHVGQTVDSDRCAWEDIQRLIVCGLHGINKYQWTSEGAGSVRRKHYWSAIQLLETADCLVFRRIERISEGRCAA